MATAWGTLFLELLSSAGFPSQRAFGQAVGMSQGNISKAINGHPKVCGPPLDRLDIWADALKLPAKSAERQRFIHASYLAHSPEHVRILVASLERKLANCRKNTDLMLQEFVRLGVEPPKISRD